jgi:hypothetical protein
MNMRSLLLIAAGVVVTFAPAAAQTAAAPAPVPSAMMLRAVNAALPLNAAYREIGRAEQAGATGRFLEAARTHYRGAMDRNGKNDAAGAAAEARLASDLARVALDERPAPLPPTPRDLPPPPPLPSGPPQGMMIMRSGSDMPKMPMPAMPGPGMPGMSGLPGMMEMHAMMEEMHGPGGFAHMHGFDATHLAELLKIETGAEAHQLAQAAVDANSAAQRAALAGNVAEARKQTRISGDLMAAVSSLVALNHPEMRRQPRIMFQQRDFTPVR